MSASYDLIIRGGTVIDGTGSDDFVADVAISDGVIAKIGEVEGTATREIDAKGLLVTPGFVDIHTHYDGQATWDERLTPSSWHGVTTAVMGNCGVGFAPCRPEDHTRLIHLMEGVEDIPEAVLEEGLEWNWESFPDFLNALEARPHDIDFAAQLPHGALRVFVMGERGANREPATDKDIDDMAAIAEEAMRAGALGFSTSRTLNHRTSEGNPTPTLTASREELVGIAMGLKRAGAGVLQVVSDFQDPAGEFGTLQAMMAESGRPLSFTLAQTDLSPDGWKKSLVQIENMASAGLDIRAQVCGRPVGLMLGLAASINPFTMHRAFQPLVYLSREDRVLRMKDPELKRALLEEVVDPDNTFVHSTLNNFDKIFDLGNPPDYEPTEERSVTAIAAQRGVSPKECAYDLLLEDEGRKLLYFPFLNYADGNLDAQLAMLKHPRTVPGLGDGGAHVGMISDASFTTHLLTHWTRDRTRGDRLSLPFAIKAQTHDTAEAVGLLDRGVLAPGYKADINIIDYEALTLYAPHMVYDLPEGGKRLIQKADGYVATIVSGEVIYENGEATGALPGKLVRGAKPSPMAAQA